MLTLSFVGRESLAPCLQTTVIYIQTLVYEQRDTYHH